MRGPTTGATVPTHRSFESSDVGSMGNARQMCVPECPASGAWTKARTLESSALPATGRTVTVRLGARNFRHPERDGSRGRIVASNRRWKRRSTARGAAVPTVSWHRAKTRANAGARDDRTSAVLRTTTCLVGGRSHQARRQPAETMRHDLIRAQMPPARARGRRSDADGQVPGRQRPVPPRP